MSEATWWRHLKGDPTRFLLSDDEPGVVWRTLVEVLGRPHDSPAVTRARRAARELGAAAFLLQQQDPLGYWGSPVAYGARWGGTAWHMLALAQLGADPEDPRVARGAEVLLRELQPRSGGFAPAKGRPPAACFTAEVCAALARFGFAHHPRVREAVAWLADREEGGKLWSCTELRHLVDGACPVAAVAVVRLVAEFPPAERPQVARLATRAGRGLLERGLWLDGPAPRGWLSFAQPNLAHTDLLDALTSLARARWQPEPPILAALERVLVSQDSNGCWAPRQAAPFGEPAGQPSRWLTLRALVAVAAYGDSIEPGPREER